MWQKVWNLSRSSLKLSVSKNVVIEPSKRTKFKWVISVWKIRSLKAGFDCTLINYFCLFDRGEMFKSTYSSANVVPPDLRLRRKADHLQHGRDLRLSEAAKVFGKFWSGQRSSTMFAGKQMDITGPVGNLRWK